MKALLNEKGKPYVEVLEHDGYYFPDQLGAQKNVNVPEFLAGLNELNFRDDEICVVSYPKSGTHWTFEICNMLKSGRSEFIDTLIPIFDYSPKEVLKFVQSKIGVYTSHFYPRHMPKQLMKTRCKIIHVYRNPKDVAVSYFNFIKKLNNIDIQDMSFSEFLRHFVSGNVPCGSLVKWIEEWTTFKKENPNYPLLEISYEEMKNNLKESVERISNFLGLDSSPELIEDIARKCDFDVMSAHKNSHVPERMKTISSLENTHIFYRKGGVGDWKNHFTVAENEAFDKSMETILPILGLKITHEL
ncbi:sulfotransferase 1E1-like [Saccostrea echinata]|uniref:sulfotransferase 1E1-like n=1 Tax=Saccostrea echinata TaxID=191078 RepID=UPI002A7FB2EE|nr:sulfotransferase 1E1-like [Saccostrea echinata]